MEFVVWRDSCTTGPWIDRGDISGFKPEVIFSVGFVGYEDDSSITLVQSMSEHQYGQPMCIPKATIEARLPLEGTIPEEYVQRFEAYVAEMDGSRKERL